MRALLGALLLLLALPRSDTARQRRSRSARQVARRREMFLRNHHTHIAPGGVSLIEEARAGHQLRMHAKTPPMWWRQENYHLGDPKSPDAPPPREEQEADYWAAMNAVAAAPPPPPPPPASKDRAKFWNILDWHKADGSKRPPDMINEHVHNAEALKTISEELKWDAQKKFKLADTLERQAHLGGVAGGAVDGSEVGAEYGADIADPKRGKMERAAELRSQGKLEEMDAEMKEHDASSGKSQTEEQQPYDKAIQEAQAETPKSVDVVTDPLNPARGARIRQEAGISPPLGGKTGGYSVGPGNKDTLSEALAAEPIDTEDSEASGGPPGIANFIQSAERQRRRPGRQRHERTKAEAEKGGRIT